MGYFSQYLAKILGNYSQVLVTIEELVSDTYWQNGRCDTNGARPPMRHRKAGEPCNRFATARGFDKMRSIATRWVVKDLGHALPIHNQAHVDYQAFHLRL